MPFEAHKVGCTCDACMSAKTPAQREAQLKANDAVKDQWLTDAKEAGKLYHRTTKDRWTIALLIARNVQPGTSQGKRTDLSDDSEKSRGGQRVSCYQFAKQTGAMSDKTVTRYWNAWQDAARRGWVPESSTLTATRNVNIDKLTEEQWETVWPKPAKAKTPVIARGNQPKVTAKDRSPEPDTDPSGTHTESREPAPVIAAVQHPIREKANSESALAELKEVTASLILLRDVPDAQLAEIISTESASMFLSEAAEFARRIRKLRKAEGVKNTTRYEPDTSKIKVRKEFSGVG